MLRRKKRKIIKKLNQFQIQHQKSVGDCEQRPKASICDMKAVNVIQLVDQTKMEKNRFDLFDFFPI